MRRLLKAVAVLLTLGASPIAAAAPNDTVADRVFGQKFLDKNQPNLVDGRGLNRPRAIALDRSVTPNRIYVTDTSNSRVLAWSNVVAYVNGNAADFVIGQPDEYSYECNNGGVTASSLCFPEGVAVDSAGNLYVADTNNSRVLLFNTPLSGGDTVADKVFGQPNMNSAICGVTASNLCRAAGVAVDSAGNLYVADSANSRVLEYNTPLAGGDTAADKVFGQPDMTSNVCSNGGPTASSLCRPAGVAVDSAGNLYVSDDDNHRVLEYNTPLAGGDIAADKVFGQPSMTSNVCSNSGGGSVTASSLCFPRGVAVDSAGNLYVADSSNHRVLEYNTPLAGGDTAADKVFGQIGFNSRVCNNDGVTPTSDSLCNPQGVAADSAGNLYVADRDNSRVLVHNAPVAGGDKLADKVFGQISFTLLNRPNRVDGQGLNEPGAVALDRSVTPNRVYVADTFNNRVLAWSNITAYVNGDAADRVIGQFDMNFYQCRSPPTASSLCFPAGVAVDSAGNLYVADTNNSRVLLFKTPLSGGDTVADEVFGQPGMTSNVCNNGGVTASSLCEPFGVAVDSAGNLYVADANNSRVLVYNTPLAGGDTAADKVFGQPNMTSKVCNGGGATASSLCAPFGVAVDSAGNLYVADSSNHRVLEYNTPLAGGDTAADKVFGQPDMASVVCRNGGLTPSSLCAPFGVAVDNAGNLYVADTDNFRVLVYNTPLAGSDTAADKVFGQPGCNNDNVTASSLCSPKGVAVDSAGNLYVADTGNSRVLQYESAVVDDYGDAPSPYASALAVDGARHQISVTPTVYLGSTAPDAEPDARNALPNAFGNGDDLDGTDDEDGLNVSSLIIGAANATSVTVTGSGKLDLWLDHDRDASWTTSPAEHVVSGLSLNTGTTSANLTVPSTAAVGDSYLRARYSTLGSALPTGAATEGEVEDHAVTLRLPTLAIADVTQAEGNGGARLLTVTVTLETAVSQDVSVEYATTNGSATLLDFDYLTASGTLTIASGATSGSFTVTVFGDGKFETDESFTVTLSNPVGASMSDGSATVTLTNDDVMPTVTLSTSAASIAESGSSISITATLSNATSEPVTVNLSKSGTATNSSDYSLANSILIAAGSTTASATLSVVQDNIDEDSESVVVAVSTVSNAVEAIPQQVTVTITDDDAAPTVSFQTPGVGTVSEATPGVSAIATLVLSHPSSKSITAPVNVLVSGAAVLNSDFTISTQQVTFNPLVTSVQVVLNALNDGVDEADVEQATLQIGIPSNATVSVSNFTYLLSVQDDDAPPVVSFDAVVSSNAEIANPVAVRVSLSAPSGQSISVPFTVSGTAGASDFGSVSASPLVIPPNATGVDIVFTIKEDAVDEENETVTFTLGEPTHATLSGVTSNVHTATITDNDLPPTVSFSSGSQSVSETGSAVTVTVQLSAVSAKTVTVPVTVSGAVSAVNLSAASISIAAGSLSGSLTATPINNEKDEADSIVLMSLGTLINATAGDTPTQTLTVVDDDVEQKSVAGVTASTTDGASSIQSITQVTQPTGALSGFNYPNGFFVIDVGGVDAGDTVEVTLTLPDGTDPSHFISCVSGSCTPFVGVVISGNVVTLTLTDGGAGDDDGEVNGHISISGAPAIKVNGAAVKTGGGGSMNPLALLCLLLVTLLSRSRFRRRTH